MGNVVKCVTCQNYYNGATYKECPYCKNITKKQGEDEKRESFNKPKRLLGFIGRKNVSSSSIEKETDQVTEKEKNDIKTPVKTEAMVVDIQEKKESLVHRTMPLQNIEAVPRTVPQKMDTTQPEEENKLTLQQEISRTGRTVGKYISNSMGEQIAPVVGWLVGIKGAYHGQSFQLKNGKNKIGRSHEMDVKLLNDESVSRTSVASIVFDKKTEEFSILPGESDSLCYVNDSALYERIVLKGYEKIEFGDSGINQYVFVPFCGEHFSWSESNNPIK